MSTTLRIRSLRVAAAACALAGGAAALPAAAGAATYGARGFVVKGGTADFGSGNHVLGNPSGLATTTFDLSAPGGVMQIGARVQGTLYWDSLDPGCARVIVRFIAVDGSQLAAPSRDVCGPGGNANLAVNQRAVDVSFAGPTLDKVVVETHQVLNNGALVGGGTVSMFKPLLQRYHTTVNSGTADFGSGLHAGGTPTSFGQVRFDLNPGTVFADVVGTLYWDSLFSAGCARAVVDFQDAAGNTLSTQAVNRCGPGGDANNAANHTDIALSSSDPRIFKVRLRIGSLAGGSFVGVTSQTFSFTNA